MEGTKNFRCVLIPFFCLVFIASLITSLAALNHFQAHAQAPGGRVARPGIQANTTGDWPELHGDAARDSDLPNDTLLSKANANALTQVPGISYSSLGSMESTPAVYQGVVYDPAMTSTIIGGKTKHISTMYAINATSGAIVWSEVFPLCATLKTTSEWVLSSPAATTGLVNGVPTPEVFVGWGSPDGGGPAGCIYDLNGSTGQMIWSFPLPTHIDSSPAVMTTNNGNIIILGDEQFFVHAFSVDYTGTIGAKGTQLWTYDDRIDVPPAGYSQYCAAPPTNCGDSVWSSPAEGLVTASDSTVHHYAYFGVGAASLPDGRLDVIDLDTIVNGSPAAVWQFWDPNKATGNDVGTVSVLNDSNGMALRVFDGESPGHVFGLDPATGAMYFDFNEPAQLGTGSEIHSNGALATINGTTELIFASGCISSTGTGGCTSSVANGYIWAIDAMSTNPGGTFLWKSQNFGSDIDSSPVVVNQDNNAVIYVLGPWRLHLATRGDLLALDPTNGALLADYPVFNHAEGTLSSPVVYNGRIFVSEGYTSYASPHPTLGGLAAFACSGC